MGLSNRDYMRDLVPAGGWQRRWWSPTGIVMTVCGLVFLAQLFLTWRSESQAFLSGQGTAPDHLFLFGDAAWKELRQGEWWRLLSYNFVHGGFFHLAGNLLALWLVGRLAALEFGAGHWTALFFLGGVFGAVAYFSVFHQDNDVLVGASAGIYALGAAATLRMPHYQLGIPFLPGLSVRLSYVAIGFLLIDLINTGAQIVSLNHPGAMVVSHTRIASLAHLGGALAGFLYVKLFTDTFETMIRESERRERLYREQHPRRREQRHVPAGHLAAAAPEIEAEPTPPPPSDFMEDQVNPVLEKLHAHGPGSLSVEEQHILEQAARRLRDGG